MKVFKNRLVLICVFIFNAGLVASQTAAADSEFTPAKIVICHKGQEITVAETALKGHEVHGDKIGACGPPPPPPDPDPEPHCDLGDEDPLCDQNCELDNTCGDPGSGPGSPTLP